MEGNSGISQDYGSEITTSNHPEQYRQQTDCEEENATQTELLPPPDGGYGWVIVISSFICNMVVDGITYAFGVFLAQFVDYYGVGKGRVAWVGSFLTGMCYVSGPVVGGLSNKYGCRTVCIAGSILGCAAFVLSTFSPNVEVLMLTYGIMGGIGFGLMYLPAIVCVGYYFETKRSLATGIALCGSGVGTFLFAPLTQFLLENFTWQESNLILAGIILSCSIFGALMRPLKLPDPSKHKPLLKKCIIVQLTPPTPDGLLPPSLSTTIEGPTPHSSTTVSNGDLDGIRNNVDDSCGSYDIKGHNKVKALHEIPRSSDQGLTYVSTQPELPEAVETEVYNVSLPLLNKTNNGGIFTPSTMSIHMSKNQLRPLVKKDIFYSGSVQNLQEYKSHGSLDAYRQSNSSIQEYNNNRKFRGEISSERCCFLDALIPVLSSMVDVSLIKNPVFMCLSVSNFCAIAAIYIPFVYLVDHATKDGINAQDASSLISVIGVTNTLGRIVCGWVADFPFVNCLLLHNCSLVLATLTVILISFCHTYYSYIVMSIAFGIATAVFVSITSIVLVDLLGLNKLSNAFGLLMLFRGIGALVGTPTAGMIYDSTGTYEYTFYIATVLFLISASIGFAIPFLIKCVRVEENQMKMNSIQCVD